MLLLRRFSISLTLFLCVTGSTAWAVAPAADYGKLPLHFERNEGQTDGTVQFLSRGRGYSLFLTHSEAVAVLRRGEQTPADDPSVLRMRFVGANRRPRVEGRNRLATRVSSFIGNDPKAWRTDIATYARVHYRALYPGIDVDFHGDQGQLEYDLVIAPGSRPETIRLEFPGVDAIAIDAGGNLVLRLGTDEIRQRKPVAYQQTASGRCAIASRYVLRGNRKVGFAVGAYDRRRPLVIDPVLAYSTFLGGAASDSANDIAVDASGNSYVTGSTGGSTFPTVAALQAVFGGGTSDAFVAKLNAAGTALVYATFLGGNGFDSGDAIAVDGTGAAYVTGNTVSTNFTTVNAVQPAYKLNNAFAACQSQAFVTKLNAAGNAIVYSTYLGGQGNGIAGDSGGGIGVDTAGNAYVSGITNSADFPTANALQASLSGSFFFKTVDSGANWSPVETGLPKRDGIAVAVDPSNPSTVYATFVDSVVHKSSNGGGNWSPSTNGIAAGGDVGFLAVDPLTPTTLYAAGGAQVTGTTCFVRVGVFKSTNAAADWTPMNVGLTNQFIFGLAIAPSNPQILFAATFPSPDATTFLFKSTNGGASWSPSSTGITSTISGLAVDPSDPSVVYVSTTGTSFLGQLLKSTNGGASFSELTSFPGFSPGPIAVDPTDPSTVYVGGFGLFKSTDGGATWEEINSGLENDSVRAIAINPTTPSTLYVGTEAGIFKSIDGGDSWNLLTIAGQNRPTVHALAISRSNPATLYAALRRQPDAFVARLGVSGTPLDYSTFLGGGGRDAAADLAADGAGNAYVTGSTASLGFPTSNAFQGTLAGAGAGCGFSETSRDPCEDAFVAKMNPTGSALVYSTYLGGANDDSGSGIAQDGSGNAYVTGDTSSANFPTMNAFQPSLNEPFPGGGHDAFVTKLNAPGNALVYSTYLGGSSFETAASIAVDGTGAAVVGGNTSSSDFPLVLPVQCPKGFSGDAFVTKLSPAGSSAAFSTILGGSQFDNVAGVAVDAPGNLYAAGSVRSDDFPTESPLQGFGGGNCGSVAFPSPCSDAFVAKFAPQGTTGSDLYVAKCVDKTFVLVGSPLTYTVYVSNGGPQTANAVSITDLLPPELNLVSATSTQGTCGASNPVTCDIGSLASGAGAVITIEAEAKSGGPAVVNTASATTSSADPKTANNSSTSDETFIPVTAAIDPFRCYKVKPTKGTPKFVPITGVRLVDAVFGNDVTFDVKKPSALCLPADKNDEGRLDDTTHLERYAVKAQKGQPKPVKRTNVTAATQLGTLVLDTGKPQFLLVPTAKSLSTVPSPPVSAAHEVDHFECYQAKISKGQPKFPKDLQVTVADQFTALPKRLVVKKPTRLCMPVDKNGEGTKHVDRLVCYQVKPTKGRCGIGAPVNAGGGCKKEVDCGGTKGQTSFCAVQAKFAAVPGMRLANQFGNEQVDAAKDEELCLPSLP